ncbi:DSBA oxidoreductase [Nitrobacter sp. Nb-311A]|uniref:DsbA family protein n=1 Tax=unclassified Nitrobacter TaxID=2620411 RepID=UPI0000687F83|nr:MULTISPECIES: DsbA family protein [unclassified Nitrobacter]EAQ36242.1 DSBA oxidoreductase [Nitrobacter sp. Nb-311A]MCB1393695.1 DsbA family protein [Nitrobacter sp.]MCV0387303.1 DsbA family protein [Nitrobacter sp.]
MPTRRGLLRVFGVGAVSAGLTCAPTLAEASDEVLTEAQVLRDQEIPAAGNAHGDITIVEYFDYNCSYCRKLAPELAQVVHDDGKVRLIFKDWPILGPVSVYASRLALASKYQGKFIVAHQALISTGSRLTESRVRQLLADAKIDVDRALKDMTANAGAIGSILKRNNDQAIAFGFNGTPSFIIGKFRVPGVLTKMQFGQAIADARKAAAAKTR